VLPHSWFLGGPFRWTDDDRDKQLAWQRWDAERCQHCKTRRDEWLDEHGREVRPPPYEAALQRCPGCHAGEREMHAARDQIVNEPRLHEGDVNAEVQKRLSGIYPILKRNPDYRPPARGGD
jgi:hypothetical protein